MLVINNLNAAYGKINVLGNINLSINAGEVVTVLGANGAGKSTLLMSIMNQTSSNLTPTGEIIFNNQNLLQLPTHEIAKLGIALVPEGRRIFPQMTVTENLQLGSVCAIKPDDSYINTIYDLFPILKTRSSMYAGNLSGGEQQMLAIGRALMSKPKLLLLDEPSLGLAPKIVSQIFEILQSLVTKQTTILIIEQNIKHAIKLAQRYYVLANGSIVKEGTQAEFYTVPDIEKYYLG